MKIKQLRDSHRTFIDVYRSSDVGVRDFPEISSKLKEEEK